jgi:hypothetical protein
MIQDLTNINDIIKNEGLEICIVSYGGSGSNELTDILEMNGYKCRTPTYCKILCHCPVPIKIDIPIIYIYRDIIDAFFSQKRRGRDLWAINQQKLSNNLNTQLTDNIFFNLMVNQFIQWKNSNLSNVLFVNYKECFDDNFKIKLENFLGNNNLSGIPFTYKKPKTKYNINEIDPRLKKIFLENKTIIEETNH